MPDQYEYEVYSYSENSTSLTYTGGELKIKESGIDSGFGVRVLERGRLGFAYCQSESDLEQTKESARKASKFSPKSGFSFAPKSTVKKIEAPDKRLDPGDYEKLHGLLREVRDCAEAIGGTSRVIISASTGQTSLENTEGFSGRYSKSYFSTYVETMRGKGRGFGYAYHSSNKLPKSLSEIGKRSAGMAKEMDRAKKPETGKYTIVMEAEALQELIEVLLPSFSGDWKRKKITKLSIGERRFSEQFTLCDDGLSEGTESRPFDDEGSPSKRISLVDKGEVRSFLFDRETAALAKEAGVPGIGGACTRSDYDSAPAIGNSNITVGKGTWKDLGELDRYLEVHSVHGSHTANVTTGDFGLEANVAFMVNGGKRTAMRGFMISGNIFELFSNIEGIERKPKVIGNLVTPRIAFRDVKIVK